jgi:hypothetical protein
MPQRVQFLALQLTVMLLVQILLGQELFNQLQQEFLLVAVVVTLYINIKDL